MKALNFRTIAIAAALFFAGTSFSFAQHDHGDHSQGGSEASHMVEAPHGGMIQMSGKYHLEMVVNMMLKEDKVTVYLLSNKGKPVSNEGISGSVMFMYADAPMVETQLVARGDDHFVAQLENKDPFTATVSFVVKGKTVEADFVHEGMPGHGHSAMYSCPMHSDVTASDPGNCPKCGMELVQKK